MRLKSCLWISVGIILAASMTLFAQNRNGRSRDNPAAAPWADQNSRGDYRDSEKNMRQAEREREKEWREADRERDKEWREYLKARRKAYKEWAKADRQERDDFERYQRDRNREWRKDDRERDKDWREADRERDKEWREYLKARRKAYKEWSRASREERDDFERYRRDRGYSYEGQYGGWESNYEPREGACFYTDADYRGERFCVSGNEAHRYIGDRYNDRISSVRIFGRARVYVYEHENAGGARRLITNDVSNLRGFNDKISSIEVR